MGLSRKITIWTAFACAVAVPVAFAATSPQLAWRDPVYIVAGFAGVLAMVLLLAQPLLAGGYLPGQASYRGRNTHRLIGGILVSAVVIHVAALWITSPPDVIDALLFRSPTPFSAWGVIAMWAIFASALLAKFRQKLRLRTWRLAHRTLAAVIVSTSVLHALLIDGTMETVSKTALSALVIAATFKVLVDLWNGKARSQA